MPTVDKILASMRENPRNVRYDDLLKVCEHHLGHRARPADRTPCSRPRGRRPTRNIQNGNGQAKAYQVRQVLAAIDKKEAM